jgi:succinoglycan biosynthesis transport protein ExoP
VNQPELASAAVDPALRRIVVVLKRNLLLIAAVAIAAAALAYVMATSGTSTYRSESVVELTDDVAVGISSTGARRGDARVEIEAQRRLIESSTIHEALSARIGANDADDLRVSTSSPDQTPVIVISVEASSASVAEAGASAIVGIYVDQRVQAEVDRLEGELEPLRSQRTDQQELVEDIVDDLSIARESGTEDDVAVLENRASTALDRLSDYDIAIQEREFFQQTIEGRVRVIEEAGPALETGAPALTRAIQFGLLGLLLSAGLVIGVSRVRSRLLLLDEVRAAVGPSIPILATVPRFSSKYRKGSAALVVGTPGAAREAESFRYARSAVEVAAAGRSPMSVLLTSSTSNEGKTVTSSNLALASARSGRSTALLDGDLLNSSIERMFWTEDGLRNAFRRPLSGDIDPTTQHWHQVGDEGPKLDVLLAPAHVDVHDREELSVDSVGPVLRDLKKSYDVVIVDGPPVLAVSDAMILARCADVTVLIIRMGTTTRRDLETAITQLRQGGVTLAGIIATQTRERGESYYGYDYDYTAES